MGGQADYCRLPSLNTHREPSIRSHPDYHRSSLVTMASSTMTHDNVTLTFGQGSVETMNISDGTSTTVTIDTYDSNASNPSITPSQRANVGSLGSSISNASVSTEGMTTIFDTIFFTFSTFFCYFMLILVCLSVDLKI